MRSIDQAPPGGSVPGVFAEVEMVDEAFVAARMLDGLQEDEVAINRRAARRAEAIFEVVTLARRHPEIYTIGDHPGDLDHARRSALFDVALRLQISENEVRSLFSTVETALELLPLLWARAREGLAGMRFVEAAAEAVLRLRAAVGADDAAQASAAEAIALVDRAAAEWALTVPISAFRRRVRVLADRLDPEAAEQKHARGLADRRVVLEEAADGMSWLMALVPTVKAVAIKRRLTSAAKHLQKAEREGRTRDQLRADLACDWLTGAGTDKAVSTTVFVTVPVGLLTGDPAAPSGRVSLSESVRGGNPNASSAEAQLVGHGPIDARRSSTRPRSDG